MGPSEPIDPSRLSPVLPSVRSTHLFCHHFILKNDHFAKTGSGQTWENLREKGVPVGRGGTPRLAKCSACLRLVRKPPFLSHVVLSDRFTKTGSGQTWDGLRGKSRFAQGALVQYGHAAAREAARRHQPSLRSLRCGQLHCTTGATKPSLSVSSLFVSFRFKSLIE
jgi:hypothetical protein